MGLQVSPTVRKSTTSSNDEQHTARKSFDPIAEEIKGIIKQIDLLYKLTARIVDLSSELPRPLAEEGRGDGENVYSTPARRADS